jgi:hypothetical protein
MRAIVAAGLAGSVLLGRGRAEGLALMEDTPEGAWRSFFAAFICLPAFLAIRFFAWASQGGPGGLGRALVAELIGYTIAWVGFGLISLAIVSTWGRAAQWPRFIAAWNWTNVLQYAVILIMTLPGAIGLPALVAQAATLAGLGYALWLEWFVARHALGVGNARAIGLVVADLTLGLFIGGLIASLSGG